MTTIYDPWTQVKTRHGLAADEVISALQKEIRRGHTENAALIAYEMATTSAELEAYLWKRLQVISVEDIGWGEINAPVLVRTLWEMTASMSRGEGERLLFAIHAVRFLCRCQKDRGSDEMINWVIQAVEKEGVLPQIPDYALDVHTQRGKEMGRGLRHFWEVGAQLSPELEGREVEYRARVLKALEGSGPA
jgi:replication-associated recombination protein RarA